LLAGNSMYPTRALTSAQIVLLISFWSLDSGTQPSWVLTQLGWTAKRPMQPIPLMPSHSTFDRPSWRGPSWAFTSPMGLHSTHSMSQSWCVWSTHLSIWARITFSSLLPPGTEGYIYWSTLFNHREWKVFTLPWHISWHLCQSHPFHPFITFPSHLHNWLRCL
jgi:hypothetical protein